MKMIHNQTKGIQFSNIELLCQLLDCTPNELFTIIPEKEENS